MTLIAAGIPDEEDAIEIALTQAWNDRPCEVMRIAANGNSRVIDRFGEQ